MVRVPLSNVVRFTDSFSGVWLSNTRFRSFRTAHLPFHHLGKADTDSNAIFKLWGIIWTFQIRFEFFKLVHPVGFEPTTNGFEDRYSSNWAMGAYSYLLMEQVGGL